MRCFLIFLIAILFPRSGFCTDENIIWYHADIPPYTIINGNLKGKGSGDLLEQILQNNLSEYKHVPRAANYSRIIRQLKNSNGCCVALLKTPSRDKFIEFSKPAMVALHYGVCILESRLDEFKPFMDDSGYISIKKLFEESNMKMGISSGRNYMKAVDDIIKNNPNSKKIVICYEKNITLKQLVVMAAERGIDYLIEFPDILSWTAKTQGIKKKMKYIPIKESEKNYLIAYIGCTKNNWGEKIISKINSFLTNKHIAAWKNRYQDFLPPEERKRHNEFISEVFPELESSYH